MTYELRKQLSAESLTIIERALDAEAARLAQLHWGCVGLKAPAAVFTNLQNEVNKLQLAKSQLQHLFIDQFPRGRLENDTTGHTGLPPDIN